MTPEYKSALDAFDKIIHRLDDYKDRLDLAGSEDDGRYNIRSAIQLAREAEQLRKERDELFTWQNNARHAKAELDLERIRLQDIIRDMEAKLDKAKWQPIETARPYTDILMMVMLEGKYQKCQVASFVIWEDKPLYADWHWQPPPTHWMLLPDAPEQP